MPTLRSSRTAYGVGTFVGYCGMVAWMTWPLAAHLTTHLPATIVHASCDLLQMTWALAFQSHALMTAPRTLLGGNVFHPTPMALFYGDAGIGALPYFLPIFALTGNPILAMNGVFIGGAVLTATALHLVVHRWTRSTAAGWAAAMTFLTTRWVLWDWNSAVPTYQLMYYVPLIMLLVASGGPRPDRSPIVALLVVLQAAAIIYVGLPLLGGLALLAVVRAYRTAHREAARVLVAAITMAVLGIAVLLLGFVAVRLADPGVVMRTNYLPRPASTWLPGGFLHPGFPTGVQPIAMGVVLLGGLVAVLPTGRPVTGVRAAWAQGLFWTLVGVVCALPGTTTALPGPLSDPFGALRPWFSGLRPSFRLGLVALPGLSVLVGAAIATLVGVIRGALRPPVLAGAATTALGVTFVALLLLQLHEGHEWPAGLRVKGIDARYPIAPPPVPASPLIDRIRERPGALVEVPTGSRPAFCANNAQAMFRSIFHWRPILNGYDGYLPDGFAERMRLADALPDPEALAVLRRSADLTTVLVHTHGRGVRCPTGASMYDDTGEPKANFHAFFREYPSADSVARWLAVADAPRADLRLLARDGDDLLFAAGPP